MRLLVLTPTYVAPGTDKIVLEPECEKGIISQKGDFTFDWIIWKGPYSEDRSFWARSKTVLPAFKIARELVITGRYDALIDCQSDAIMELDVFQLLLDTIKDTGAHVAVAPYRARPDSVSHSKWVIFGLNRAVNRVWYLEDELPLYEPLMAKGEPFKVMGAGGVTLYTYRALAQCPFRYEGSPFGLDTTFSDDCYKAGLSVYCVPKAIVKHKDKDGSVY